MMTIAEQLEKQGIKKGKKKGIKEEQFRIAQNMLQNDICIETVSKITLLEVKTVKKIKDLC